MKKKFLSVGLLLCMLLTVFAGGCTGNIGTSEDADGDNVAVGTKADDENVVEGTKADDESLSAGDLSDNITCSGCIIESGYLIVFAKNKNDVAVDIEIEVEFYNSNGKVAGSDSDNLYAVGAGAETVVEMYSTPKSFKTYKIYADAEVTDEICYFDYIELEHNDNGEEIAVQAKNNSDDEIEDIEIAVVYYQDDEAVGYDDDMDYDVKSGRSANFTLDYPYDSNYNDVDFDSYKVYLNEAYSYDW